MNHNHTCRHVNHLFAALPAASDSAAAAHKRHRAIVLARHRVVGTAVTKAAFYVGHDGGLLLGVGRVDVSG